MKKILILAVLSLIGVAARCQSISPVYAEGKIGKKPAKGQFTVTNKSIQPMAVTVEPKQLVVVDGKPTFGLLQPGTTVELKDTSAVVPPKSSRTFDYSIRCEQDCMVMLLSGMMAGKTKEGINVKLWIPSSVYLCREQKGCRERTKKAAGLS